MNMSYEQAQRICKEFTKNFFLEKCPACIHGVGISSVGLFDSHCTKDEKDHYCIVIWLVKALPSYFPLPKKYKDLKVFTEMVGSIISGR